MEFILQLQSTLNYHVAIEKVFIRKAKEILLKRWHIFAALTRCILSFTTTNKYHKKISITAERTCSENDLIFATSLSNFALPFSNTNDMSNNFTRIDLN